MTAATLPVAAPATAAAAAASAPARPGETHSSAVAERARADVATQCDR